jgi:hypothetical protein
MPHYAFIWMRLPCLSGRYSNILAWNRAASVVFGDLSSVPEQERNWLWLLFTNSAFGQRFVDREAHAQEVLEMFRHRTSTYASAPYVTELVEALTQISPEFRQSWSSCNVRRTFSKPWELQHPIAGHLVLETTTLHLSENPNVRCCIFLAADAKTATRLNQLFEVLHNGSMKCPRCQSTPTSNT